MSAPQSIDSTGRNEKLLPNWLMIGASVLVLASVLVPIWALDYFPSQNGPQFLLIAHMFSEIDSPEFNYGEFYERNVRFIPHILHNSIVIALDQVFDVFTANKIALSFYAILVPFAAWYLLRPFTKSARELALISVLMVYNYSFLRGYTNFTLTFPLFCISLGYWIRHRYSFGIREGIIFGLLSLVTCAAHLWGLLVIGFVVLVWSLCERRPLTHLFGLLFAFLPTLALAGNWLAYSRSVAQTFFDNSAEYRAFHTTVLDFLRKFLPTVSTPGFVAGAIPFLLVLGTVAVLAIKIRKEEGGLLGLVRKSPQTIVVAALTIFYFATPWTLIGWHPVNARFTPYLFLVSLTCLGHASLRWRRTVVMTSVVGTVVMQACVFSVLKPMSDEIRDVVAACPKMERNATLLPVHINNPEYGDMLRPFTRVYDYVNIRNGGVTGWSVARLYPSILPVIYKTYPSAEILPVVSSKDINQPESESVAANYDYVVAVGQEDESLFPNLGLEPVHKTKHVTIYRNPMKAVSGGRSVIDESVVSVE